MPSRPPSVGGRLPQRPCGRQPQGLQACTAVRRPTPGTPPTAYGRRPAARQNRGPRSRRSIRDTGQINVVSMATWVPCHGGTPLASTSTRRQSASSKPMFMSRTKTLLATRAPASRQTHAAALSRAWYSCKRICLNLEGPKPLAVKPDIHKSMNP